MKKYRKHIKLLKEIRHLAWKIKGTRSLTTHERETAINNTFMSLLKKEEDGVIKLDDYETYKGYMFLTIRNFIYRIFEHKKTRLYRFHSVYLEETIDNEEFTVDESYQIEGTPETIHITINNVNKLKELINVLPLYKRALLRWNLRGWSYEYISKMTGINESTLGGQLQRIKKKIKYNLNQ